GIFTRLEFRRVLFRSHVAAGTAHTCAVEDDATVWCFGSLSEAGGALRQIESGPAASDTPRENPIVTTVAGTDASCALRPGRLSRSEERRVGNECSGRS